MVKPIDKLQKTKRESRTEPRDGQFISVGGDRQLRQIDNSKSISDEEFERLLDKSQLETENIFSAEAIFAKFYENAETAFFQSFREREKTLASFQRNFGDASASVYLERAEKIVAGTFDLLGFKNLDFGAEIDWHFEPVSGKRSPLKHWKQFDEEFSTEETDNRQVIFELNRCQHFFTLGVAFWLTGDERFAETFARHLQSWIKQNPFETGINWNSSHEVALRSVSWIWAFQFFKDSAHFTPEIFSDAVKSLFLHATHIETNLSASAGSNTRLTGEALGLYYLGTQFPFFERASFWRETGEKILFSELDRQILTDGVYFRRSSQWQRYTTDFYTHFYILRQLNSGEIKNDARSKLDEKLQSSLDFLMYTTRPDGTTALLGEDDGGGRILPRSNSAPDDFRASLATGALIFRRGDYKFVAREFAEETLWLLGADAEAGFENLEPEIPAENSAAFPDGGYCVMRDGWTETDNYLLVDFGDTGARGHADALSIDAAVGGKTLLVNAGGTYTSAESNAARSYFRSTEAHNTLIIDQQSQSEPATAAGAAFNRQIGAKAKLHRWFTHERFDFFEGSHGAYERFLGAGSAKHSRSILFLKNDYWIMRDFVETSGEHRYALNFHFAAATNPAIEATEDSVCVGEKPFENVGSRIFSFGDNASWAKEESSISLVYGKTIRAPRLKFVSNGVGSQEFFTFLLPHETGLAAPEVLEVPVEGGRAFVIVYREYRDIFVFADGEQIVRTEIFDTNFRFSWARLSEGEKFPEEFVLIGGTYFALKNRKIIDSPQMLEAATARRFGNQLNVRTSDESVFRVSLAGRKRLTYVLKN